MSSQVPPSVDFSALIYGSLVSSLLEMTENVEDVNKKLDEIGYRIGLRLAHEFARDKKLDVCKTPQAVIDRVIIPNWENFIGRSKAKCQIINEKTFKLSFDPSVYTQNVTIPELYSGVKFTAMLPGVLRGIFEIFHQEVLTTLAEDEQGKTAHVTIEVVKEIPIAVPKDDD